MVKPAGLATYIPSLDGVRALAVGLVVALHSGIGLTPSGQLGVDMFFVLSGYLITSLLLAEHGRNNGLNLPFFYARRALRLYPALIAMVAAVLLGTLALDGNVGGPLLRTAWVDLLYLTDLVVGWGWGDYSVSITHTWSLAVEEHFYLVWPLIMLVGLRSWDRRRFALGTAGVSLAMTSWTAWLWANGASHKRINHSWDTRSLALGVGCAIALALSVAEWRAHVLEAGRVLMLPALCSLLVLACLPLSEGFLAYGGYLCLAVLSGLFILGALQDGRLTRLLRASPLVEIGKRSYGIYLWHFPVFQILTVDRLGIGTAGAAVVKLAVTAVMVELSYRAVEQPALRLRHRFAARSSADAFSQAR